MFLCHYLEIVCNFSSSEIKHQHHPRREEATDEELCRSFSSSQGHNQKGRRSLPDAKRTQRQLFLFDVVDLRLIKGAHLTPPPRFPSLYVRRTREDRERQGDGGENAGEERGDGGGGGGGGGGEWSLH